jgi:hypothetical protein
MSSGSSKKTFKAHQKRKNNISIYVAIFKPTYETKISGKI